MHDNSKFINYNYRDIHISVASKWVCLTVIQTLATTMAMEKDDQGLFNVDESKTTTFGSNFSTQRAANIVRWILVILPTVISILALVGMVVAILIFSSNYNEQKASLDAKTADLEVLNASLQKKVADIQSAQSKKTYVRWGNSTCPDVSGTSLVYSGRAGGTSYTDRGGAANHLCMPMDPEYVLPTESGVRASSLLFGSEYESIFLGTQNENIPCAVCLVSTRAEVMMVPAKVNCPPSWTREYYGYLMSERNSAYRTMFICVDVGMESVPNSSGHQEACDLWHVEASCISLPCPPYDQEKEMGCVVCSK